VGLAANHFAAEQNRDDHNKKANHFGAFVVANVYMVLPGAFSEVLTKGINILTAGTIGSILGGIIAYPINWLLGLAWLLLKRKERREQTAVDGPQSRQDERTQPMRGW